jgi:hypothetical protein
MALCFEAHVSGIVLPAKGDCCRASLSARRSIKTIFRKHGYHSNTNATLGIFDGVDSVLCCYRFKAQY